MRRMVPELGNCRKRCVFILNDRRIIGGNWKNDRIHGNNIQKELRR